MTYTLIATSTMGVESILAQEIKDLGFEMAKKAIVEKLKLQYKHDYFSEDGALYRIKIIGNKDNFIIMIDTSGAPLHKS